MSVAMGNNDKAEVSDAEIIQRAKQLGMVDAEDNGKKDNNDSEFASEIETEIDVEDEKPGATEKDSEKDKVSSTEKEDKDKGSINSLVGQNSSPESDKLDNGAEKKTNEKKNEDQVVAPDNSSDTTEYVSFTVKSGQVCRQIAENMQKQGIIDDADAFRGYMARRGLASSIRCGTFDLPKGATYEKLAECLTTR